MFDLNNLLPEHFENLLGSSMTIDGTEHSLIVEAMDLIKSPSPRGQPFSVKLRAPAGTTGVQGIYHLVHPELGVMGIFLVPVELSKGSQLFEAVFN